MKIFPIIKKVINIIPTGVPTFVYREQISRVSRMILGPVRLSDQLSRSDKIGLAAKLQDTIARGDQYRIPNITLLTPEPEKRSDSLGFTPAGFVDSEARTDRALFAITLLDVGTQNFVVPPGVTSMTLTSYGAQGGDGAPGTVGGASPGALGARATCTITTTPGETLQVRIGGRGVSPTATAQAGTGGSNGGGTGLGGSGGFAGGGGGGATDVRQGGTALANRVIVGAGGGGGGAGGVLAAGGAGGTTTSGTGGTGGAGSGAVAPAGGGAGGTASAGGAGGAAGLTGAAGTAGASGAGGSGAAAGLGVAGGGGGGAGRFGGGGGGSAVSATNSGAGGGGGSSLVTGTGTSITGNVQTGDGKVTLSFAV